jgi:hypothetical protein
VLHTLLVTLALTSAPAPPAPAPPAPLAPAAEPAVRTRIVVLDLEAVGAVDQGTARSIDPLILGGASIPAAEVLAQSELKKLAEVEAGKAEMGCDDSSCLAELAGAMGARFVLFGTVSKLGDATTVSISMFDSRSSTVARDSVAVRDLAELSIQLPPRVRALVEQRLGLAPSAPLAAAPVAEEGPSALFMGGVVVTAIGGAALVAGGSYAAINEASIQDPATGAATKRTAQEDGAVGLGLASIGALVTGVGIVLIMLGGDA